MPKTEISNNRTRYTSESQVILALREHFPQPEWVVLPQVRNRAGFDATRTADALVMSVWPSRGLHLYGIEIKVSRADWLRELRDPKKADAIGKHCDFWFMAVGDEEIVKDGELPASWGLLVPGKQPNSLTVRKTPEKIECEHISRSFLAAILRKAFDSSVPFAEVEAEITRRVEERSAIREETLRGDLLRELNVQHLVKQNEKLKAAAQSFADASGIWIDGTNADTLKTLGKALKLLQWTGLAGWIERAEELLDSQAKSLKELRAALPKERKEPFLPIQEWLLGAVDVEPVAREEQ